MSDESSEEFGPRRYPDSDSDEADTDAILKSVIEPDYIKLDFQVRDKIPNRDGWIEVVDEGLRPVGNLVIQVKKLHDDKLDPPKFQCDREYLEYSHVISSPLLLLGVDTVNEVVYWKHLSPEWVDSLDLGSQKSQVVHFPKENIIDGRSTQYISDWKEIVEDNKRRIRDYDEFEQLKEVANPALGESRPEFETIHRFLDEYNGFLNNEFSVVSGRMYPGVWKFGYANIEYSDERVSYGLYPLAWDENDVQIMDVDRGRDSFNTGLTRTSTYTGDLFDDGVRVQALRELENDLDTAFSDRYLRHEVNDFLCREIIFGFVDRFHGMTGLGRKEYYRLDELEFAFDRYIHLWIDSALGKVDETPESLTGLFRSSFAKSLYSTVFPEVREEVKKEVEERIDSGEVTGVQYNIRVDGLSILLFDEAVSALRSRGFESVERPYPMEDLDLDVDEAPYVWSRYSPEAFEEFVKAYMRNLVDAYRSISKASFPELDGVFDEFDEVTDIVVEMDDRSGREGVCPVFHSTGLKRGDSDDISIHFHSLDSSDDCVVGRPLEDLTVDYEGSEYEWFFKKGESLSGLLDDFPLLCEAYDRIEKDIDEEYFSDVSTVPYSTMR